MTTHRKHPGNSHPSLRRALLAAAAVLCIGSASPLLGQTYVWTGADTPNNYNWSDTANWQGGLAPATSANPLTIAFTNASGSGQSNYNDIVGLTNLTLVVLDTMSWDMEGNQIGTKSGTTCYMTNLAYNLAAETGSNYWDIPLALASTLRVCEGTAGGASGQPTILSFGGLLSGTGSIYKSDSAHGAGQIYLLNSDNSFNGSTITENHSLTGAPVDIQGGYVWFNSMNTSGQNSSMGAGTTTNVFFGGIYSSSTAAVAFIGATNCSTDRPWNWVSSGGGGAVPTFSNNSPNNANLTFLPNSVWTLFDSTGSGTGYWNLRLGATSTGTTYFYGNFMTNPYPLSGTAFVPLGLVIVGPGNWVFGGAINNLSSSNVITGSAHVMIVSNEVWLPTPMFLGSGSTLDVSWNDVNSVAPFTIGSSTSQSLSAGHTGTSTGIDIVGSLEIGTNGKLYPAGVAVAGTLTITNAPSTTATFVAGPGTIVFDLGTNNTAPGSNDLIAVKGNLDLSQGPTTISINTLVAGTLTPRVPYTLFTYTGTLTGNASGLSVPAPNGSYSAGVVSTSVSGQVTVTFTSTGAGPSTLLWNGYNSANWDTYESNFFVLSNGAPAYYVNGDNVIFDDTALNGNFNVNVIGDLTPLSVVVSNNLNAYTFGTTSGGQIGAGSLTKDGSSMLTVNLADSYTGANILSAGTLIPGTATALGSGPITMGDSNTAANAANGVVLLSATAANIVNPITVTTNCGNGAMIGRITSATLSSGGLTGGVTLNTNLVINLNTGLGGYAFQVGAISGTGNVTTEGTGHLDLYSTLSFLGNLYNGTNGSATDLDVDTTPTSIISLSNAAGAIFYLTSGVSDVFNALTGGGEISPSGNNQVVLATLTLGQGNGNGLFTGQFIDVSGNALLAGSAINVNKTGTGKQIFTGDSSGLLGTSTIEQGTMELDNGGGSGLPVGSVTVDAGATLSGQGSIELTNGDAVILGTLEAGSNGETSGNDFYVVDVGSGDYVSVASGGALAANIWSGVGSGHQNGGGASDQLEFNVPVSFASSGAILNVTNLSGNSAFAIGDSWQVIDWDGPLDARLVTNNVTVTNLPPLPATMVWDTSALTNTGDITVITNVNYSSSPTQPATITSVAKSSGDIVFSGAYAGGTTSYHYDVLSTTNLSLPLASWTVVSTGNSFVNPGGTFSVSITIPATPTVTFYTTKVVQ